MKIILLAVLVLLQLAVIISNSQQIRTKFYVNLGPGQIGEFEVDVHKEWAPIGANRFLELVNNNFFVGCRFFRVIPNFLAQFGLHGKPQVTLDWAAKDKRLKDDPITQSNKRGLISFAASKEPNTRTTQIFINLDDNGKQLDSEGFAPFAEVVSGMDVVERIFPTGELDLMGQGKGDGRDGLGPIQMRIVEEGNKYLKKYWPKLAYITKIEIINNPTSPSTQGESDEGWVGVKEL